MSIVRKGRNLTRVWTVAFAATVSLVSAPGWAVLNVDWAPSNPTTTSWVSISAWQYFPDPGQELVSTSYSLIDHTINIRVVMQDLHWPGSSWPTVVVEDGGTAYVGLLAAGTYEVNAQMLMVPWYGGGALPYDSGTTTFVVTPEPASLALLALGGLLATRYRRRCRETGAHTAQGSRCRSLPMVANPHGQMSPQCQVNPQRRAPWPCDENGICPAPRSCGCVAGGRYRGGDLTAADAILAR